MAGASITARGLEPRSKRQQTQNGKLLRSALFCLWLVFFYHSNHVSLSFSPFGRICVFFFLRFFSVLSVLGTALTELKKIVHIINIKDKEICNYCAFGFCTGMDRKHNEKRKTQMFCWSYRTLTRQTHTQNYKQD
ncbi:hypothetical protein AAFF_G00030420 [Aldrovandia affinis]|uniref:Uncharacterized protein n=1 Tax=Aldrovandia affinis TaxID=143900 RepID=A0AAD7WFU5_9TELE|nr:hypothetical protein AAFF_G00030420 [Aldrovandia affinis]